MEKTYRVQNLVVKFVPALIKLFGFSYNWAKEDKRFEERLAIRQDYIKRNDAEVLVTKQSFIDLLLKAEDGDGPSANFLTFVNALIDETLNQLPDVQNKLKAIGELACLKKLIDSGQYELKEIESPFPNGKPKDYLFQTTSLRRNIMIEIVNIHAKCDESITDEKVIEDITEKLRHKVLSETMGVKPSDLSIPLLFMPVLWNVPTEWIERNRAFFEAFNIAGKKYLDSSFDVVGFTSLLKHGNKYFFGEVLSHFQSR
jgi:hypothetical protein